VLPQHHLKALKLPALPGECEKGARRCAGGGVDHRGSLPHLCALGLPGRERRAAERRLKAATFAAIKALADFAFLAPPSADKPPALGRLRCHSRGRRENVPLVGNPGTGQARLAAARAGAAGGPGRPGRCGRVTGLVTQLMGARQGRVLARRAGPRARPDLLVLDELGCVPARKRGAGLLFDVSSTAYERRRVIVTTNLPLGRWVAVPGSERRPGAVLDRLPRRCPMLELNGESDRRQGAERRRRGLGPGDPAACPAAAPG
jgi:DNA replication protein DnaC